MVWTFHILRLWYFPHTLEAPLYQSKEWVCYQVCYADNLAEAVDRLFISNSVDPK